MAANTAITELIMNLLKIGSSKMETQRKSEKILNAHFIYIQQQPSENLKENYQLIAKHIQEAGKKYRSILFASVHLRSLPVTIPVNVGIRLAKDKKRCLLIDLDLKRDAIARVFELDSQNSLNPMAIETEIENLWVWPAHQFTQLKQMNMEMIVEKAASKFDFILINAPQLITSPDRRQIIQAANAAFICAENDWQAIKLTELIKPTKCKIIGHIQTSL